MSGATKMHGRSRRHAYRAPQFTSIFLTLDIIGHTCIFMYLSIERLWMFMAYPVIRLYAHVFIFVAENRRLLVHFAGSIPM